MHAKVTVLNVLVLLGSLMDALTVRGRNLIGNANLMGANLKLRLTIRLSATLVPCVGVSSIKG